MNERLPVVDVNVDGLCCSCHARPWKETWQIHHRAAERGVVTGPLKAGLYLLDALLKREEVARRYDGNITAFKQADWQPICCYIAGHDPEALARAYTAVGVAPPAIQG